MAHGIHAAVLAVQAPVGDPAVHPELVESRLAQLLHRDAAVLARGNPGDCGGLVAHIAT